MNATSRANTSTETGSCNAAFALAGEKSGVNPARSIDAGMFHYLRSAAD